MSKHKLSLRRPWLALGVATLSLAVCGWAGNGGGQVASSNPEVQMDSPAAAATATTMPNEVVTVNRFGVYPAEIARPTGAFALVVHNKRGTRQETFTIIPSGSVGASASGPSHPPLATMNTTAAQPLAISVLNLPSGTYVLQFQNNPQFSVKLTIQ